MPPRTGNGSSADWGLQGCRALGGAGKSPSRCCVPGGFWLELPLTNSLTPSKPRSLEIKPSGGSQSRSRVSKSQQHPQRGVCEASFGTGIAPGRKLLSFERARGTVGAAVRPPQLAWDRELPSPFAVQKPRTKSSSTGFCFPYWSRPMKTLRRYPDDVCGAVLVL